VIDLDNLYITAYVEEGHIGDIRVHAPVDIRIAAVTGVTYHGRVAQILPAIAGIGDPMLGVHDADGNLTSTGQRIPVRISVDGEAGRHLFPGGSAYVTIHTR
jgi:membrane fusion protein (multidrug efflux system)